MNRHGRNEIRHPGGTGRTLAEPVPDPQCESPGRSFRWLNVAQFLGALNDNVFKLLVAFYLIGIAAGSPDRILAIAGALFVLPFLVFTPLAGSLADRLSKRNIIVAAKASEVLLMGLGAAAFLLGNGPMLYAVLFGMALQSALFGPAKLGIIPELVPPRALARANSILVAATFLAVVLGTGIAPALGQISAGNYAAAGLACVGIAVAGFLASLPIRRTPPARIRTNADPRGIREALVTLRNLRDDRRLFLAILAAASFSLIGAFLQLNLIPFGMDALGLTQEQSGYLFLLAAVGIGLGALVSGRVSGNGIEFGPVPIGAAGLAVGSILLGLLPPSLVPACLIIVFMGMSAGLFIVPLQAFVQHRSPADRRGRILAASGVLGWTAVLAASGLLFLLGEILHVPSALRFLVVGLLSALVARVSMHILPGTVARFFLLLFGRIGYRVRVYGLENVPRRGPALIVANHVSWVDAIVLMIATPRPIRFLMGRPMYERRGIRWIAPRIGAIPISPKDPPRVLARSLRQARAALDDGDLVCIFAEGALTRTGVLQEFRPGMERIVRGTNHPILPVAIDGLWASIFSYARGRPAHRFPRRIGLPVRVVFGPPIPADTTAESVRETVCELAAEAYAERFADAPVLPEAFVKSARRHWHEKAMSDPRSGNWSYGKTLTAAVALAERIRRDVPEPRVGILLPPTVAGAVVNLAVAFAGKTAVNLNFTASEKAVVSAIEQCGIRTVITSRDLPRRIIRCVPEALLLPIERILPRITPRDRLRAALRARFAPLRAVCATADRNADDVLMIVFSSGTTGDPKGVELTHRNILANVEAIRSIFRVDSDDDVAAVLPFFHSFGATCTLWLPLLAGISVSYQPNPLDAAAVGDTVEKNASTLLFAPPTFLAAYARRVPPAKFASLRAAVAGAEKLRPVVADAFESRFGLRPLEGYGATELAPAATMNIPDVEIDRIRQPGCRPGSVGRPLPGVAVRVVDPETGERLPAGEEGLLLVRGANVMRGYLNRPEETAKAIVDGWYRTGDIARIDPDGFVWITDRLSRFGKIAGEMVPHGAVEEELHRIQNAMERVLAVTSIPDKKRGERLVVLCGPDCADPARLHELMQDRPLPNLWKPALRDYVRIDALPYLGSGKLDLRAVRRMAEEAVARRASAGTPAAREPAGVA